MLGKIDLSKTFPQPRSISNPSPKSGIADFQSLFKEKIEEFKPLEGMALQYLSRAVELILSQTTPEENDLFFPAPPAFPLPMRLPAPEKKPSQPQQIMVPANNEASNNLQKNQDFEHIIKEAGLVHGVDPSLIRAVVQTESDGNPLAVSRAGAQGLMQIMPATAAELGIGNPFDPVQNIMGGTLYLRRLLNRYHGDVKLALAAYNWGMGNLEKRPEAMPQETKNYIAKVQNHYRSYLGA
jgi:soluble lytic murein transglycosylase-like protein